MLLKEYESSLGEFQQLLMSDGDRLSIPIGLESVSRALLQLHKQGIRTRLANAIFPSKQRKLHHHETS